MSFLPSRASARLNLLTKTIFRTLATATTAASHPPILETSDPMTESTLPIIQRKHLGGRTFTLNRPAAFNALTLDMIRILTPQLQCWEASDACNVIMIKSNHKRAFCAGGDVKTLVSHILDGNLNLATQFMYEEYQLNHLIATCPKPIVAICDGITMGGGVGISVHAPFRIATEKTVFAMPETAIGLFPDVGGSFFLPRLDGGLGTYLALTGDRLMGPDCVTSRVCTHFVPSERIDSLTDRLCELEVSDWGVVNNAIEEFAEPVSSPMALDPYRHTIDKCFNSSLNSVAEIMELLHKDNSEFSLKTLNTLSLMSPLALHLTIHQIQLGKQLSIAEAFKFEWRLVNKVLQHPDFVEGVSAKLLKKPSETPNWYSKDMTVQEMTTMFQDAQGLRDKDHDALPLLRPTTYMQYPHQYLALPSESDVCRVVRGEDVTVGHFAFMSVDEVVEFFASHWPFRQLLNDTPHASSSPAVPAHNLDLLVGSGKIGVREHVRRIVNRCCTLDQVNGMKWTWMV